MAGAHAPFDQGLLADGLAPSVKLIYACSSQALDGTALLEINCRQSSGPGRLQRTASEEPTTLITRARQSPARVIQHSLRRVPCVRESDRGVHMAEREALDTGSAGEADRALKAAHRMMWALGDYHKFATSTVWELGPVLVEACGIARGQRVLDVAAGTGNVAIRAAMTGAAVVASDLTPENFEAGRHAARVAGVAFEWIEGDAEDLPFEDEEFDVVTSCLGAMFAPNQQKVADELLRVCRPGGTIGMINFTPEGTGGAFFGLFAPYAPPPSPGSLSPVMWGNEEHVRKLFGQQIGSLEMSRREYVERAASPRAYLDLFKETFGPMVAIYSSLADQPERSAALARDFLEFVRRSNRGTSEGPIQIPYEYLLVLARKRR